MDEITLEQKLDKILYVLTLSPRKSISNIQDYLKRNQNLDLRIDELNTLLDKLEKDGNIKNTNQVCELKYEGRVFEKLGGYSFKASTEADEALKLKLHAERLIYLENQGLANSNRLNDLTADLVKASWCAFFVGIGLLIWQIIIYIWPPHSDVVHVILQK